MSLFDKFKAKRNRKLVENMYLYSEQDLDEYETYIEENFGTYESVFHEMVSPDIHLDIIIIPPTKENPFYKLITMGMGAYRMNVPNELANYELEYAELIIYLPGNWNIQSPGEKNYWPIRYLKVLSRLPLLNNTWLGFGHTVCGNEEMEPFAENTGYNSFALLDGCNLNHEKLNLRLNSGKKINLYQLFPLYKEELEYKLNNSLEALLDLFDEDDMNFVINLQRKNYCR